MCSSDLSYLLCDLPSGGVSGRGHGHGRGGRGEREGGERKVRGERVSKASVALLSTELGTAASELVRRRRAGRVGSLQGEDGDFAGSSLPVILYVSLAFDPAGF